MPITPLPSCAPIIRLATAEPCPLVTSEMPLYLTMFCVPSAGHGEIEAGPITASRPLPSVWVSAGVQLISFIQ